MKNITARAVIPAILLAGLSAADTVYFKDGSQLDGTISRPNPNCVALESGGGRMIFPVTEVASIEENDKEGVYSLAAIRAKRHNDMMKERTGLDREQRDKVRRLVAQLNTEDPNERRALREELKGLNAEMPIYQYLDSCLPYVVGPRVPEMMQVMVELDPERSQRMLMIRTQDICQANRAKALELIGKTMKTEGVDRIAQGMIDHDPEIQITAAHTLGEVGDKRASKVLLQGLSSEEPRLKNAAKQALAKLWSTPTRKVEFDSPAEWQEYLSAKLGGVEKVIDPGALKPLITPDPEEGIREYVDE